MKFKIIYIISILIFLSCKKKEEYQVKHALFISYNLDNEQLMIEGNEPNLYNGISSDYDFYSNFSLLYDFNGVDSLSVYFETLIFDNLSNTVNYNIAYKTKENVHKIDTSLSINRYKYFDDFYKLFNNKSLSFRSFINNTDGIVFTMYLNDDVWTSTDILGSNIITQHGGFVNNYFNIKNVERIYSDQIKEDGVKVFADFEITLYNQHNDSILLKNGNCALLFLPKML